MSVKFDGLVFVFLGVYLAAYDMKMEWLVVKGICGYADGTECDLDEWAHFASVMAASVVDNILSDSVIFQGWPNFKGNSILGQEIERFVKIYWVFTIVLGL